MDQNPLQEHENFVSVFNNNGIQPGPLSPNTFCNINDATHNYTNDFSTTNDNIPPVLHATINNEQYLTPSFAANANATSQYSSHMPQFSYNVRDYMTNANSQIIEIPGYKIIIIPTSTSLTNWDAQHQLQQGNLDSSYSVNPSQLNQEQQEQPFFSASESSTNATNTFNHAIDDTQAQHQQNFLGFNNFNFCG